ncbi:MAG: wax ester/triacylglycerol synthase family O-acyltransferase [Acidimicrobiia bacterium]
MEQLKGLDSLFIHHETEHAPLHVLAVMNISRRRAPYPVNAQTYRKLIAIRINNFPGLCKKLVDPPVPLAAPLWIRTKPDLRIHIKEATLGENGVDNNFDKYLSGLDSVQLERSRPLWELHVIHEKENDITHLVAKAHHALLDGIAGFELIANIFDVNEEGADEDLQSESVDNENIIFSVEEEIPDWTTHIGATFVTQPFTWAQSSIKVARNFLEFAKTSLDSKEKPYASLPWRSPEWPKKRILTKQRIMSEISLEKDVIKQLRKQHGCSFHDVLGAITAGALRNLLIETDELPDKPMVCMSPVSIRRKRATHGNELSVMFAQIPTHIDNSHERIEYMKESFNKAKDFLDNLGSDTLDEVSQLAPWSALGSLWNLYANSGLTDKHAPFANLMLSSLPGPSFPLYCAGAQVLSAYPYGPIFDGTFLNVTAISYLDKVNCGIVSCPDVFTGVEQLGINMKSECDSLFIS